MKHHGIPGRTSQGLKQKSCNSNLMTKPYQRNKDHDWPKLRKLCNVRRRPGPNAQRDEWTPADTNSVFMLRDMGLSIEDVAYAVWCGTKRVQQVLKAREVERADTRVKARETLERFILKHGQTTPYVLLSPAGRHENYRDVQETREAQDALKVLTS